MIICLTSLARAGKDTFADYLVDHYGFVKLNLSDVLKEELLRQGLEPNKENMSLLGDTWRQKYGMDVVMRKTLENAKKCSNVVITGARSVEEITYLKSNAKDVVVISIKADAKIRFMRKNNDDKQSWSEFFARDQRDIENKGLSKVLGMADYAMTNNFSSKEEFYKEIDKLMAKLGCKVSDTNSSARINLASTSFKTSGS